MKLYKVSLLSLFMFLSLLVVVPVFAAETPVDSTSSVDNTFIIANVVVQNTKIISQDGNKIDLSFDIKNGPKAQAELKYSISLVKDINNISKAADEYVFPGTFSLNANTITKNETIYTAPSYLSGEYSLIFQVINNSGIVLGVSDFGKVKISSTTSGLSILSDSCSLSVVNEKGSTKYKLNQLVSIDPTETLSLNCNVLNSSKKEITATPIYETHLGTIYGEVVKTEGGDVTPITLKPGESRAVNLSLPKSTLSQNYTTKVVLFSDTFSNSVSLQYAIKGLSVSIKSLSLDKGYYTSGDTANISMLWSNSLVSSNFKSNLALNADNKELAVATPVITLTTSIIDENQHKCISPITQVLDYNSNGILNIPAKITRNCKNPQTQIQIKDDSGKILVDKQFSFTTDTESAEFLKDNTFFAKYGLLIIIGILIVVVGLAVYFINLKKKGHAENDLNKENEKIIQ